MSFPRPFRSLESRIGAVIAASASLLCVRASAEAAPARASLGVQRDVGAETCPNEEELARLIEGAVGEPILSGTAPRPVALSVRMRRDGARYVALIELSGERTGTRTIEDDGPGCDALAHAIAVTVSVLLDTQEGVASEPPPPDPNAPEPAKFYALRAPEPEPETKLLPITFTLGTFYDFGTLDGSAAGIVAGAEAVIPILSFGASFLTLPHAPRDRPELHAYRFFGARVRVCTREPYVELFGASACLGLLGGSRQVHSDEGTDDGAWLAALTMIEVSRRVVGPFGMYADLGLSIPFFKESLDFRPKEEPVTFQMGTGFRFWIEDPRPAPSPLTK